MTLSAPFWFNAAWSNAALEPPLADTWYVYMVECQDGSLYTGVTKNPARRMAEPRAGGCRYTRAKRGLRMLRSRRCSSKVRAYRYEWALKQAGRARKLQWCARSWEPRIRKE